MKRIIVLFLAAILSMPVFAGSVKGRVAVTVGEVDATVRVEGQAAQVLFESLDVSMKSLDLTTIKETNEIACFQYNADNSSTYSCVIFVFVNKNFISTISRYF